MHKNNFQKQNYPVYPSVQISVPACLYSLAVDALLDHVESNFFFDGETILVPKRNPSAIELLLKKFSGVITQDDWGLCYEYATLAQEAGVDSRLVSLGHSVFGLIGQTATEMIQFAILSPDSADLVWTEIYLRAMESAHV
jgi:hypothetical protein